MAVCITRYALKTYFKIYLFSYIDYCIGQYLIDFLIRHKPIIDLPSLYIIQILSIYLLWYISIEIPDQSEILDVGWVLDMKNPMQYIQTSTTKKFNLTKFKILKVHPSNKLKAMEFHNQWNKIDNETCFTITLCYLIAVHVRLLYGI